MKFRRNLFFSWPYSAQTVRPPPKLAHKRHILGMSTIGPETIPIARNCGVWAVALSQTPPRKHPILAVLGPVKYPALKFGHRFTSFISKSAQEKWPKVRVVLVTENETRFDILRCNTPGRFPANFCVSAQRYPSLIFRVSSRSVRVWGDNRPNRNPPPTRSPCKVNAIYAFEPVINGLK